MKLFLYRVLCGFCLGISIFAPGISGSVMAILLGIYDNLLEIAANPFHNLKKNIRFLFPMGIGAVISFILFIALFSYLFETYEQAVCMLFVGLIIGNLPVVFRQAQTVKFRRHFLLGALLTAIFACGMGILGETVTAQGSMQTAKLWYLGLGGGAAGFASLIPGMSVSMILIVMNVYEALIAAVKALDMLTIAVVGTCFVLAMVLSSRVIRFVFARFAGFANYMVIGFLLGSIGAISYGAAASGFSFRSAVTGLIMLVIGLCISLSFVYFGKKVVSK